MSASVSALGDSGWLFHVQTILAGSAWIAARVALEAASVLVHCRYVVPLQKNTIKFTEHKPKAEYQVT